MGLAFKLRSEFTPKGDQPAAIESLIKSFEAGYDAGVKAVDPSIKDGLVTRIKGGAVLYANLGDGNTSR